MHEKKWRDTHQADGVAQRTTQRGRLIFTPGNAVIRKQACDPKDSCSYSRGNTHQNIANHISATPQSKINLQRPAQHVCRCAITNSNSCRTDRVAEGHDGLWRKEQHVVRASAKTD